MIFLYVDKSGDDEVIPQKKAEQKAGENGTEKQ